MRNLSPKLQDFKKIGTNKPKNPNYNKFDQFSICLGLISGIFIHFSLTDRNFDSYIQILGYQSF